MMPVVALVGLCALVPAGSGAQDMDRRVPVKPGGLLQVDLDLGEETRWERVSLDVRSHDADEVWAVADLSGLGSSTVKFRLEHSDSVVRVYGRVGGLLSWILGGPGVHVRLWVPREFSLDLRCASGPIRVENITGSVAARTTGSAIELTSVEGDVRLRSETGDIQASEIVGDLVVRTLTGPVDVGWVTGDVDVRTGEGEIQLRHVDGGATLRSDTAEIGVREMRGRAEVKTERGAIFASFVDDAEGQLETRRGAIEVQIPGHLGMELDARTRSGIVEVGPGIRANGNRGTDHFVGTVNGGGGALQIYTARGNVRVDRR